MLGSIGISATVVTCIPATIPATFSHPYQIRTRLSAPARVVVELTMHCGCWLAAECAVRGSAHSAPTQPGALCLEAEFEASASDREGAASSAAGSPQRPPLRDPAGWVRPARAPRRGPAFCCQGCPCPCVSAVFVPALREPIRVLAPCAATGFGRPSPLTLKKP
eukprot:scaffold17826_cov114-Isochrysis_galbana.AAC.4